MLLIVAVGQRMPDWAQTAVDDYAKRFPPELRLEIKAVKTENRGSRSLPSIYAAERERIGKELTAIGVERDIKASTKKRQNKTFSQNNLYLGVVYSLLIFFLNYAYF